MCLDNVCPFPIEDTRSSFCSISVFPISPALPSWTSLSARQRKEGLDESSSCDIFATRKGSHVCSAGHLLLQDRAGPVLLAVTSHTLLSSPGLLLGFRMAWASPAGLWLCISSAGLLLTLGQSNSLVCLAMAPSWPQSLPLYLSNSEWSLLSTHKPKVCDQKERTLFSPPHPK